VTITSYNEWHEGTQIEPARQRRGYQCYEGAWGRHGERAAHAYLDRTAYWAGAFRTSAQQPSTSAS
jgi:glycoprotein endo-alpha-1,2-mannosidase